MRSRAKIPALGVVAACWLASASASCRAEPFQTDLAHVILIDAATKTVLFERGADDLMTPASTSKIMTAELIFEMLAAGTLKADQLFTVSETAWRQGGAPSHGSTMFAKLKSQISVADLLNGLIVDSANDAAIALAEGVAGSQGAFATRMTKRARELGLPHLTFTDPWGADQPDQKVTAREMALLSQHLIVTFPQFYSLFAQREFAWNKIKQPNRNPLLAMDIGADGLKTGNIDNTGYSIVGSAVQNGQRLIVSAYGARSASDRADETRKLLQWGFRTFESRRVFAKGDTVGYASVYGGAERTVPVVTKEDVFVLLPKEGAEKLNAKIVYEGPLLAPVPAGASSVDLKLYRGSAEILSVSLSTATEVPVGSLAKRALDAGLGYVGDLFRKYVLHS